MQLTIERARAVFAVLRLLLEYFVLDRRAVVVPVLLQHQQSDAPRLLSSITYLLTYLLKYFQVRLLLRFFAIRYNYYYHSVLSRRVSQSGSIGFQGTQFYFSISSRIKREYKYKALFFWVNFYWLMMYE